MLKDRITYILEGGHTRRIALDKIMNEIGEEGLPLRPALKWFVELMENDLVKNDFKSGWADCRLEYLWEKALKHLMLLKPSDIVTKKFAIGHCYKASNYLMMFAHNLIEELRKEGK